MPTWVRCALLLAVVPSAHARCRVGVVPAVYDCVCVWLCVCGASCLLAPDYIINLMTALGLHPGESCHMAQLRDLVTMPAEKYVCAVASQARGLAISPPPTRDGPADWLRWSPRRRRYRRPRRWRRRLRCDGVLPRCGALSPRSSLGACIIQQTIHIRAHTHVARDSCRVASS